MIVRIVKMVFKPDAVEPFKLFFDQIKTKVASYRGCQHMILMQGKQDKHILFTYSIWDDEDALNRYRDSETFTHIWTETKKGFAEKAEAWTLDQSFDSMNDLI